MFFSEMPHFTFYFYISKAKWMLQTQYSAHWRNIKMNFPGTVGSKQYPNLNLSSAPYISEKPTWTEVDIDHDGSTHGKSVWGQEKKMPPRDLQFPQSPVNLNISTKWRDSQGQRRRLYLHKSWEESSQGKEKKTPAPISITQSCVSISFCASVTFFRPVFLAASLISWFICFACMFCCLLRFR